MPHSTHNQGNDPIDDETETSIIMHTTTIASREREMDGERMWRMITMMIMMMMMTIVIKGYIDCNDCADAADDNSDALLMIV